MPPILQPLLSADQVQEAVTRIARQVDADLDGEPVLLIGILKGSIHFLSDLARALKSETTLDFIQTSSYGMGRSSHGIVQIRKDSDTNLEGRNVLLVEDIVDTGATLAHLRELLETRLPKTLRVAALLSKPEARRVETPVEYVGYEIPNEFVVGYGLDVGERYRNLPYIAILRDDEGSPLEH